MKRHDVVRIGLSANRLVRLIDNDNETHPVAIRERANLRRRVRDVIGVEEADLELLRDLYTDRSGSGGLGPEGVDPAIDALGRVLEALGVES